MSYIEIISIIEACNSNNVASFISNKDKIEIIFKDSLAETDTLQHDEVVLSNSDVDFDAVTEDNGMNSVPSKGIDDQLIEDEALYTLMLTDPLRYEEIMKEMNKDD